ncbi:hypothetical protein C8Q73DRAFT_809415 [Cubamyces lactineus]|nr:hypothetical protein C8Q73DRAFT_809415 [Cubamyces lactineus]
MADFSRTFWAKFGRRDSGSPTIVRGPALDRRVCSAETSCPNKFHQIALRAPLANYILRHRARVWVPDLNDWGPCVARKLKASAVEYSQEIKQGEHEGAVPSRCVEMFEYGQRGATVHHTLPFEDGSTPHAHVSEIAVWLRWGGMPSPLKPKVHAWGAIWQLRTTQGTYYLVLRSIRPFPVQWGLEKLERHNVYFQPKVHQSQALRVAEQAIFAWTNDLGMQVAHPGEHVELRGFEGGEREVPYLDAQNVGLHHGFAMASWT